MKNAHAVVIKSLKTVVVNKWPAANRVDCPVGS